VPGGTHLLAIPSLGLARKGHMCVALAHLPPFRARDSRTCPLYEPGFSVRDAKPAQVRAHLPGFPGLSHALPPTSRHFSRPGARTSPGFAAATRFSGRKHAQVREPLAGSRHKCARRAHLPPVTAIPLGRKSPQVREAHARPRGFVRHAGAKRLHVRERGPTARSRGGPETEKGPMRQASAPRRSNKFERQLAARNRLAA
jgi:hypothetical protein